LLVVQDTMEFVYQRSASNSIDYTKQAASGRDKGGNLARRRDFPPGTMIMGRGWSCLINIQLGAALEAKPLVGN
jgi:hypothetical protein